MLLENGYETKTTFWQDFSIADAFGEAAVRDTYKRAFKEWKNDIIYMTELVMVLNHKIWQHYENQSSLAEVYNELWLEADEYGINHFKGDELDYYIRTLD